MPVMPATAEPVVAALARHGDAYHLHVVFRLPTPPRLRTETLLGVDRGIEALAAGAVLTSDGRVVRATFLYDGGALKRQLQLREQLVRERQRRGRVVRSHARRHLADAIVHQWTNTIVELAIRHRAQVIMEDLAGFASFGQHGRPTQSRPGRPGRHERQGMQRQPATQPPQTHTRPGLDPARPSGHTSQADQAQQSQRVRPGGQPKPRPHQRRNPAGTMFPRRQYQKLLQLVDAKLALTGLPRVRLVHPAYTSITCAACGHVDRANRPGLQGEQRARFACTRCGHVAHADVQAGINIARKALWLDGRLTEAIARIAPAQRTAWSAFVQALTAAQAETIAADIDALAVVAAAASGGDTGRQHGEHSDNLR